MTKLLLILILGITLPIFADDEFAKVIKSKDVNAIYNYYETHKPKDGLYSNGYSPVHTAMYTYDYKVLKVILELGYNPNYKIPEYNYTPLSIAASAPNFFKQQILLLEYGADVYDGEKSSLSFITAVKRKNSKFINMLLDRGIDLKRAVPKDLDIVEVLINNWSNDHGERLLEELYKKGFLKDIGKYLHLSISDKWNKEHFDHLLSYTKHVDYIENDESLIYKATAKAIPWKSERIKQLLQYNPEMTPPLPGGRPLILEYVKYENNRLDDTYTKNNPFPNLEDLLKITKSEDFIYNNESLLSLISFYCTEDQFLKTLKSYKNLKETEAGTFNIYSNLKRRNLDYLIEKADKNLTYSDYVNEYGWSILGVLLYFDFTRAELDKLLEKGLNPNVPGYKKLHIISQLAKKDDYETIIYLAKKGAVIENEDVVYKHLRWNKRTRDATECVEILREMGAISN